MDARTSRNGRYVASPVGFGRPTPLESGRRREAEHEAGRFLALVRAKQVKDVPAELVEMYEMYVDDTSS